MRKILAVCLLLAPAGSLFPKACAAARVPASQIRLLAEDTRKGYEKIADLAYTRSALLGSNVTRWTFSTKIAQYLGSGGAVVFGLNDSGRNAAYSGAVAALATLIEQLGRTDAKSNEEGQCLTLNQLGPDVAATTNLWKATADDSAFQVRFTEQYIAYVDSIRTVLQSNACSVNQADAWLKQTSLIRVQYHLR